MINNLTITQESFDSISVFHSNPKSNLNWNLVFTLPDWLKVWWQNFGAGAELYLRAVKTQNAIIGIAPLQIKNGTASIIGSINVCDYQDFIITPGFEKAFFDAIFDDLLKNGVKSLHLETIRPDSSIVTQMMLVAQERQFRIDYHQVDVSCDMNLSPNWDAYLANLDGKQRHELKRKMRNLDRIGQFNYRVIENKESIPETIANFLKLFPEYRSDKAEFLTPEMQNFFRSMANAISEIGILKFGVLEIGNQPVAMIMYFDYNDNIYLYNSAYDPKFKSQSVGIISKAECIRDSIERGKKRFDFLKGSEQYKYYLGGKEIPLYSCEISLQ